MKRGFNTGGGSVVETMCGAVSMRLHESNVGLTSTNNGITTEETTLQRLERRGR